jgi:hypothetical protein
MVSVLNKTDPIIRHILSYPQDFLWRDYIQELVTIPERILGYRSVDPTNGHVVTVTTESPLYQGKLIGVDKLFYRIESFLKTKEKNTYTVSVSETGIPFTEDLLVSHRTPFILESGYIANYMTGDPITTSVGRFMINFLILAYPFGDIVPYINKVWKSSEIESIVSDLIINQKITNAQFSVYADNLMYIGHSPEFVSPNLTPKSLTTSKDIKAKKAELLAKYKDRLEKGDPTAMAQIQAELVAFDKDYLKGDEAMNFLLKSKYFDVVRKKLFLTHGMVESFGSPGEFEFIPNSLQEGWTQESFPTIANEIRAASYSRAKETADSGTVSKFLLRVFSNTRVIEQDCGTTHTFNELIHKDNSAEFIYRNYVDDSGEVQTITKENHHTFIDKVVKLRSPLYCTAVENGYCFVCMGKLFENLDQKAIATVTNSIGAQMTTLNFKKSHGTTFDIINIDNINVFLM